MAWKLVLVSSRRCFYREGYIISSTHAIPSVSSWWTGLRPQAYRRVCTSWRLKRRFNNQGTSRRTSWHANLTPSPLRPTVLLDLQRGIARPTNRGRLKNCLSTVSNRLWPIWNVAPMFPANRRHSNICMNVKTGVNGG